ncbi:hypothetical protein KGD82_09810 [Nocardiopsis eucommiae]|uniref:Uncharacterized protein n=1 Tax=Nocardiopsis eucommiae TaxID=2831970 RepID=A0A975QLQ2_9ACTN|nr:hypothetical protein KGD82_09810 [Nocardiopsis eucommiae]
MVAFFAKIEHGCLILRDSVSDDDISDWDPELSGWHQEGSSIIFGVQASVDGPVECEVWKSAPAVALPVKILEASLSCSSGWLVVHDPSEHVRMQFGGIRELENCSVMVDDAQFPARVQILLSDDLVSD